MVEQLPSMCKPLGSIFSVQRKKEKREMHIRGPVKAFGARPDDMSSVPRNSQVPCGGMGDGFPQCILWPPHLLPPPAPIHILKQMMHPPGHVHPSGTKLSHASYRQCEKHSTCHIHLPLLKCPTSGSSPRALVPEGY